MNILGKLKIKPILEKEDGPIQIEIALPTAQEIKLDKIVFTDERRGNFDIEELRRKLKENQISKVIFKTDEGKPVISKPVKPSETAKQLTKPTETTKPKKILKKPSLIIEPDEEGERKEQEEEKDEPKPKTRRTKKPVKGVALLEPDEWEKIDGKSVVSRLPAKKQHVLYKVPSYYMNNREIFVNFINSLFAPYRDEVMNESENITCETIGQGSSQFNLLTHQKLVRDYLNLYTPYRGLLLYFSLGSGKSATSIAIAEGMKESKKVIVLTPASLHANYVFELKKWGDDLYKKNQCWEWISITKKPELLETLSSVLHLSVEYINKKKGAWMVNVKKTKPPPAAKKPKQVEELEEGEIEEGDDEEPVEVKPFADETTSCTYENMKPSEKISLDEQINEMIESKYKFIHYNGLRRSKLKEMTNNFETNIFDDAVVIIDEAHNFISRIVNKIGKEKEIPTDPKTGEKERVSTSLSLILYEMLMSSQNTRIVLLTGTPIINYPNEIGILYNILRGYIKTWEFPLDIKTSKTVNQEILSGIFSRERNIDYIEYSASSKKLTVTRNPFGFENEFTRENGEKKYAGVTNEPRESREPEQLKIKRGQVSDSAFEHNIVRLLKASDIEVVTSGITIRMYKALPDKFDDFMNRFIETGTGNLKNEEMFKRRIMGLTSYFKSVQEKLLPRYEKASDYHIIKIPMSDYQFTIYEEARKQERKQEKSSKTKKGSVDENGIFKEPSSTYRIFSRLYCNFVMPKPPGRPLPREETEASVEEQGDDNNMETLYADALKETGKQSVKDLDAEDEGDGVIEGDAVIDKLGDSTYEQRIQDAIKYVVDRGDEYLSKGGLAKYSPKYLNMLENIQDEEHRGLHLVYSQFRTLEGIGMFTNVLDYNGFTRFKIKKGATGEFEIDISEENLGKPTYALYTGTETTEEKETLRKIFNSSWNELPTSLSTQLKEISNNNNMGEIIKVFMITASGSEGINLRNTRYVHIMEPYWHPVRTEQVIGRARRICSHTDLPEALQTVEVFVYLMTITEEQKNSDASIELKQKDLSKKEYQTNPDRPDKIKIPFTSDEALFEISNIKDDLTNKIMTAVKEASIDCAVYTKRGNKEQLHCLDFGQPKSGAFSYNPSITKDQPDKVSEINKEKITWKGTEVTLKGKKYIYRKMDERTGNIYDYDSYLRAQEVAGAQPTLIGTITKNEKGQQVFSALKV